MDRASAYGARLTWFDSRDILMVFPFGYKAVRIKMIKLYDLASPVDKKFKS